MEISICMKKFLKLPKMTPVKIKLHRLGAGGMETEIGNCKQGIIRKIFCKSVIRLRKPSSGEKTGRKISWD